MIIIDASAITDLLTNTGHAPKVLEAVKTHLGEVMAPQAH